MLVTLVVVLVGYSEIFNLLLNLLEYFVRLFTKMSECAKELNDWANCSSMTHLILVTSSYLTISVIRECFDQIYTECLV